MPLERRAEVAKLREQGTRRADLAGSEEDIDIGIHVRLAVEVSRGSHVGAQ